MKDFECLSVHNCEDIFFLSVNHRTKEISTSSVAGVCQRTICSSPSPSSVSLDLNFATTYNRMEWNGMLSSNQL